MEQQRYIGVKMVMAVAMTRGAFIDHTHQSKLNQGTREDEGYLVEYLDGGKPNYPDKHDNFISWCPKEQFENANRPADGMTFGMAVEAMKQGQRVARAGWNGKDMWLAYMSAMSLPAFNTLDTERKVNDCTAKWIGEDTPLNTNAYIAMWTASKEWQPGWLASQSDMLSDDWVIVG